MTGSIVRILLIVSAFLDASAERDVEDDSAQELKLDVIVATDGAVAAMGNAIVIDCGSYMIRAGFAKDVNVFPGPKVQFRSVIGQSIGKNMLSGQVVDFIGVESLTGKSNAQKPIHDGLPVVMEDFQKLLEKAFMDLGVEPSDRPVMLTMSSAGASREWMEKITAMMFETFQVPQFYFKEQAASAAIAINAQYCLAVVVGEDSTYTIAVIDGEAIARTKKVLKWGGSAITKCLLEAAIERDPSLEDQRHSVGLTRNIRRAKEAKSYVDNEFNFRSKTEEVAYAFSDGVTHHFGQELFKCPEKLFADAPAESVYNTNYGNPIQTLARETINELDDWSYATDMLKNVVVVGGTTSLHGFKYRLLQELRVEFPHHKEIGIETLELHALSNDLLPWRGGAVMALTQPNTMWIDKEEYEDGELGAEIVHVKILEGPT